MTFQCTLNVTGTLPQVSARAFIQSYEETSKIQHYQKYYNELEQYYQNQMEHNISQSGLDFNSDEFHIQFDGNQIQFLSEGENAIKYEYGYGGEAPRRFMQSAVIDVANRVSNYMISDAIELYKRKTRF